MGATKSRFPGDRILAREVYPAKPPAGIPAFDSLLSVGIRLAGLAVVVGWGLSACGQLDLRGYLLAGIPGAVAVVLLSCAGRPWRRGVCHCRRIVVWWKRPRLLPLLYIATFALVVLGSIIHEPNNFDGLSYRAAKVLFWLRAHHWEWIHSPYSPINHTLPNYEWLTVPMFLATGGFHTTVVINWIAYLLIPPLFFSLLRALGAGGRMACDWMWLFPSGYLITMLAGGIGNDLLGLTAILAALHCARRFAASGRGGYLLDALLAAGFCTGIKLSNLPLPAFVLIILLKDHRRLLTNRAALAGGIVFGLLASAVIPLLLNRAHSGSILGGGAEDIVASPIAGWVGNGLILCVAALAPPIFPGAGQVSALFEKGLDGGLASWLHAHYGKFTLKLSELPQEEGGGLGLGLTVGVILCLIWWARSRRTQAARPARCSPLLPWQWVAYWACLGLGLAAITSKLGTGPAVPRNLLPWCPLVLGPVLAVLGRGKCASSRIWRVAAPLISLSVLPALLLTPSRPLVPPRLLISLAERAHLGAVAERLRVVYEVYGQRADPFIAIRQAIPPDAEVIGLVSDGGEPTAAWFKPFGHRWPVYLLSAADVEAARTSGGVQYVVVKEGCCEQYFKMPTARWFERFRARPIKSFEVRIFAAKPPDRYSLARLEP